MAVNFKIYQPQIVVDNLVGYVKTEQDRNSILQLYCKTYGTAWYTRQSTTSELANSDMSAQKRFMFNSRDIPAEPGDDLLIPFVNIGKFVSVQRLVTRAV